jgi:two-component system OmpR family response regulator
VSSSLLGNSDLTLDPATCELSRNGHAKLLSAREFALMQALLLRPGAILSRDELEGRIYGWNEEVASNAVEVIIHGLRRKFGQDAILNVRGLGWRVGK